MELYIGGYAQGKLQYVSNKYGIPAERISDGAVEDYRKMEGRAIYDHFHLWVRRLMEQGVDVEATLEELLAAQPDAVIISDEIGCGIVPMDAFEREYREKTGRLLCAIAARADRVERIVCGIGQQIK